MPVIKSAIKKLRRDQKKEAHNDIIRKTTKDAVKKALKKRTPQETTKAVSLVDKAAKKNLIHKNKAARIKALLTKGTKPGSKKTPKAKPSVAKTTKPLKTTKKTSVKK